MVFSSLIFLFCFLPIFLICYFVPKKRKTRNIVLLIFSLMFYGYGEPIYVLLMILSILVNYYIALVMDKSSSKKKGIVRKILTILLGFAIFCVFAATAFMIYIVVIGILSVGLVTYYVIKKQIV